LIFNLTKSNKLVVPVLIIREKEREREREREREGGREGGTEGGREGGEERVCL